MAKHLLKYLAQELSERPAMHCLMKVGNRSFSLNQEVHESCAQHSRFPNPLNLSCLLYIML
jgi:hypothetical protein